MRLERPTRDLLVLCPPGSPAERLDRHELARDLLARVERRSRDGGEAVELAGLGAVWLKGGPLRRHAPLRHGLSWRFLHRPPPRLREARMLLAFGAIGIPAARALLAVARFEGPLCRSQALALEFEPGALAWSSALAAESTPRRAERIGELAALVAQLHVAGFAHGDLFLRNVLATPGRTLLVDSWRGADHGRRSGGLAPRPSARELGQLLLEAEAVLTADERERLIADYLAHRAAAGATFDGARVTSALGRTLRREPNPGGC